MVTKFVLNHMEGQCKYCFFNHFGLLHSTELKVIKKLAEEVFSIVGRDPLIEVFQSSLDDIYLSGSYRLKNIHQVHAAVHRWLLLWSKLHYRMSTLLNESCTQMLISILD